MQFQLKSSFKPTGDQPSAINKLYKNLQSGKKQQVLLGVTGSGKTFTLANVIEKLQKPTLVISHNKTLAAQLYQEFRDFFPNNSVSYFVSYYDYYQPEAYIPQTDTYIEKVTEINEEIDKLRLATTKNLLTRKDNIVIASVSCIYNIGSPKEFGHFILDLKIGLKISRESIVKKLVNLQYQNSNFDFKRGTFRIRGDIIDIFPAYEDTAVRIAHNGKIITHISKINVTDGNHIENSEFSTIYPSKHFMTDPVKFDSVFADIRKELDERVKFFKKENKPLEAHRISQKVNYDMEMIEELGYVNGIENYSRYFDNRLPGMPPYTLLDYFNEPYGSDWLLIIDESHMTVPQIRGMYNGDRSRKQTLIDFGFRLPSALDNRPLTYLEFDKRIPQTVYVSATPNEYELSRSLEEKRGAKIYPFSAVVEQLIRPTGIIDPKIIIRPSAGQINDLTSEIIRRKINGERVLVTTLTKRMAEDLALYFQDKKYIKGNNNSNNTDIEHPKVAYLHSDIETLVRSDILDDLREGKYDVLIGINLLREGLDLPEVSMVAILDADKEGFLRSKTSLIQTMGRAARHIEGTVIMYADKKTNSMKMAIEEIDRRRNIQISYNKKYNITPVNINKPIRGKLIEVGDNNDDIAFLKLFANNKSKYKDLLNIESNSLTPTDCKKLVNKLQKEMKKAALELNFESAARIRDKIIELKKLYE